MDDYVSLDAVDLLVAGLLLFINGVLSIVFRLKIERRLAVAALRMIVQLMLVGLVLKVIFETVSPLMTFGAALIMVLFAGYEIMSRQDKKLRGFWSYGIGAASMTLAATIVTLFTLTTQIQADPWYHPRFAIPILGMVLGNTMTGVALGLNTLTSLAVRERITIEAQLALGFTRREALQVVASDALKTALIPIINSMSAAGLVSIPGMMTGQILSGVDPVEATKYQILIMILIAGATGIGAVMAIVAAIYRLTDNRHRLRLDRLQSP